MIEHESVNREHASLTAINHEKVAVFGGFTDDFRNDGYIVNFCSKQFTPILGKQSDLKFECMSQTQWVGRKRHMTLGYCNHNLHLVQLKFVSNRFQELRSFNKIGYYSKSYEQALQEEQKKQDEQQQMQQWKQEIEQRKQEMQ